MSTRFVDSSGTTRFVGALAPVPYSNTTVRTAAGVPTGAPESAELPFAYDTTAVSGGFYYWNGAAWVKLATIL